VLAVGVRELADAAADGERHKHALAGRLQHRQHGQVAQREVAEAGDVEEGDLVGALLEVARRQVDGRAQVAHVARAALLAHVVLVALGDHQVAGVVAAHVQAGDDALGQALGRRACACWEGGEREGGRVSMLALCAGRGQAGVARRP